MLFYQKVAWKGWLLESMDASSAFLQARGRHDEQNIYTIGVKEMSEALGIPHGEGMKILKAWYGLTDAPRCFWLDVDEKMIWKLNAVRCRYDPCTWLFLCDTTAQVIGVAGTHVDDFQIAGDDGDIRWINKRKQILDLYDCDSISSGSYRYAGVNNIQHPNRS